MILFFKSNNYVYNDHETLLDVEEKKTGERSWNLAFHDSRWTLLFTNLSTEISSNWLKKISDEKTKQKNIICYFLFHNDGQLLVDLEKKTLI